MLLLDVHKQFGHQTGCMLAQALTLSLAEFGQSVESRNEQ